MNAAISYGIAIVCAVIVHAVAIGLMSMNWDDTSIHYMDTRDYYIEASVVSENPFTAREERAADKEQSKRDRRIENRRQVERKLDQDQAKWMADRDKRLAEQQAQPQTNMVVPTPQPEEQPEPEPIDEEAARSAFEQGLSLALIEEQNLRKAITDDEKAMAYASQIRREIEDNWSRPPSARNGMQALLRVQLVPTGEVIDVKLEESSGNAAFDRSAMTAVRKAGRFVVPQDSLRFERDFREFTVLFRPEDLRL